jgi:YVTN family beta-propeller protein
VIGPNGTIDSAFKGVSQPVALTSDGRFVWLADASSSTVTRLDPHAPRTLLSVTVTSPSALAAVKGNVWVLSTAHRQLQEVNEDAGEAVRTIRVGNGAIALAAADGSVWVADITDGTVTRVDAMSGRVRGRIVVGGQPDAVTAGTGAVWVADRESGTVDRIDPESDRITASIPTGGHPSAIAVAGGQVWVADPLDGTLSRIDPASDAINATLPIGVGGNALATDGRWLWVDGPHPGELTRIDAVHARATSTIHTGSPTVALASARHRIFAATTRPTAARRGGTLTIVGTRGPMPAWAPDPGATFDQDSWQLQAMTNDGLLAARKVGGAAGAELVPDLASSMPVASDGGRTWTFQLRRGLRYSTGQPVRASDVRASFERLEQIAGPAVKDLPTLGLVGEAACRSRPRSCDLSRGVLADDRSGTVVLRLVRPESDLLQRLATPPYFVLPAGTQPRPITAPPFPATGPYEVVTRRAGEIQLARNPYFHAWSAEAQPPGFPDRIVWRLRASAASGVNSILSGRGDVLDAPATTKDAELLATRYPTLLHLNPFPDTEALFLNTRRRPFSSLAARQAVALATNRRVLAADQGTPLVWPVTCQVLPPGIPGYRPFCPYTANAGAAGGWSGPDLARARELARRAHLSGTTITVAGPSDRPAVLRAVTDFAHGLRAIGLRPRIISRPVKGVDGYFSFIAHHRARIQAGWFHWFIDRPDPAEFLDPLASCPGHGRQQQINANAPRYCDRTTDAAITHAEAAMNDNPTAAAATWAAVDARVTRSAAWIPYANGRSLAFTSRRASGYAYNPIYSTLLDQISIK